MAEDERKASIYKGMLTYNLHDGNPSITVPEILGVDLGNEPNDKAGQKIRRAARLAGYYAHWICVEDRHKEWRLLIIGPRNEKREYTSLSEETAQKIVDIINNLVELAETAPSIS